MSQLISYTGVKLGSKVWLPRCEGDEIFIHRGQILGVYFDSHHNLAWYLIWDFTDKEEVQCPPNMGRFYVQKRNALKKISKLMRGIKHGE